MFINFIQLIFPNSNYEHNTIRVDLLVLHPSHHLPSSPQMHIQPSKLHSSPEYREPWRLPRLVLRLSSTNNSGTASCSLLSPLMFYGHGGLTWIYNFLHTDFIGNIDLNISCFLKEVGTLQNDKNVGFCR